MRCRCPADVLSRVHADSTICAGRVNGHRYRIRARGAHQAIREQYEVANETLRYTLPRVLADETRRKTIVGLRTNGWLDWEIVAVLADAAWNWRVREAGIQAGVGDPARAMRLARQPQTRESPEVPLGAFSDAALAIHTFLSPAAVAKRWGLRGRQQEPDEEALRDLLKRRYRYGKDDVQHRDLLDCVHEDGRLRPFLEADTNEE